MHCSVHVATKIVFVIIFLMQLNGVLLEELHTGNYVTSANTTATNWIVNNETKEETGRELEARKKEEKDMMSRILPMMVIPFMVSTGIIPMMLVSLKFMLIKSALIGKLAVLLLILNMFRSRSSGQGGVFTHNANVNVHEMSMAHYGYSGDEEYGAYINRRKRNSR